MAPENTGPVEHLLALKAAGPFATLPSEDLALLVDRATARRFGPGETLLPAGEPVRAVHLVLDGRVTESRGGRRWATRESSELVGGVDVFDGGSTDLMAVAETPVRTLELERGPLVDACLDRFDVLATVAAGIAAVALAARRRLGPGAGFAVPDRPAIRTPPYVSLGERVRFLGGLPPLADAPVRALAQVAMAMEPLVVNPGHRFWSAGDAADHLVVLVAGTVACSTGDGAQRFTLGSHDVAGLLDMLAGTPRWYDARADGRVVALRVSGPELADALEDEPDATLAAVEGLARATVDLLRAAAEGGTPH